MITTILSAILRTARFSSPVRKRKTARRPASCESLERRELMTADLAWIAGEFNIGLEKLRTNSTQIAVNAFSTDLADDIPLIREESFAKDMKLESAVKALFTGKLSDTASVDALMADLGRNGFSINYLGTEPNASGDFLRVTRNTTAAPQTLRGVSTAASDLEGLPYFKSATGSVQGTLSGSIGEFFGVVTIGLDDKGIYLGEKSTITARSIALSGGVQGRYKIGELTGVTFSAQGNISGRVNVSFSDRNDDGKIRLADFRRDDTILGQMTSDVTLRDAHFRGDIPLFTSLEWSGQFASRIRGQRVTPTETLAAPAYSTITDKLNLSFVEGMKQLEWVKRLDRLLAVDIPLTDKSLGELVKFESIVDLGMSKLGIQLLPSSQQKQAMLNLISGRNVDLVTVKKSGSITLGELNLAGPVSLIDAKIFAGIVDINLSAGVTAELSFTYDVNVGIGNRGFWIGDTTSVGIESALYGNLNGTVSFLSKGILGATGSIGLVGAAKIQLSDNAGTDHRINVSEFASQWSQVPAKLQTLMSADFEVFLRAKAKAYVQDPIFGKKFTFWKDSKDFGKVYESHEGPKSGGSPTRILTLPASINDELGYEAESLPLNGSSGGAAVELMRMADSPGLYSNGAQAVITGHAGDWIEWTINSRENGRFGLNMSATTGRLSGDVRILVNDQIVMDRIGLGNNVDSSLAEAMGLGVVNLKAGANRIRVELLANEFRPENGIIQVGIDGFSLVDPGFILGKPSRMSNIIATNPQSTAVDLHWIPVAEARYYQIEIIQSGRWTSLGRVSGDVSGYRIDNLIPNSVYSVRVTAANALGISVSPTLAIRTLDVVPAAPGNLRAENIWSRTIDLKWDDRSANESEYRISISRDGGATYTDVGSAPANSTSFRIENLSPDTRYSFSVRAINSVGSSLPSNSIDALTRGEVPSTPGNLRIDNLWARTVDLRWDDASNNETEFRIAVSRDGGVTWDNIGVTEANATSLRVTDLAPGTSYLFKIRAANAFGFSEYGNILSVITRQAPPASPENLRIANIYSRAIDLNWDDQSNNEAGFIIMLSSDGVNFTEAGRTGSGAVGFRVTGLRSATRYYFRVVAFNDVGSNISGRVDARTRS